MPDRSDDALLFMMFAAFAVVLIFFLHDTNVPPPVHCPKGFIERESPRFPDSRVTCVPRTRRPASPATATGTGGLTLGRDEMGFWGPNDIAIYRAERLHSPFNRMLHSTMTLIREPDLDLLTRWSREKAQACLFVPAWKAAWAYEVPRFCHPALPA